MRFCHLFVSPYSVSIFCVGRSFVTTVGWGLPDILERKYAVHLPRKSVAIL